MAQIRAHIGPTREINGRCVGCCATAKADVMLGVGKASSPSPPPIKGARVRVPVPLPHPVVVVRVREGGQELAVRVEAEQDRLRGALRVVGRVERHGHHARLRRALPASAACATASVVAAAAAVVVEETLRDPLSVAGRVLESRRRR